MDKLSELRQRKAELKRQIEAQRNDLKKSILEIREEIEPANLLKKAVSGIFRSSKNKQTDGQSNASGLLSAPLALVADLLIKDPRMALLVKLLSPLALKIFQKNPKKRVAVGEETANLPKKANIYSGLRESISKLRRRLKKAPQTTEKAPDSTPETTEN